MTVTVQMMFAIGEPILKPYTNTICKYCGKPFYKEHNKTCYCSDECRLNALREQKAEYQRKRRKLINKGVLVSNEKEYIGTQFLSQHRQEDFEDEYESIQKEMKRLKLLRR